nr:MAG TPA: hypothetical protein [Caudoviricetes sp.]
MRTKSPRQSNLSFQKQTARQSPASLNATKRRTPGKMIPFSTGTALSFWKIFWKKQVNSRNGFLMKNW